MELNAAKVRTGILSRVKQAVNLFKRKGSDKDKQNSEKFNNGYIIKKYDMNNPGMLHSDEGPAVILLKDGLITEEYWFYGVHEKTIIKDQKTGEKVKEIKFKS